MTMPTSELRKPSAASERMERENGVAMMSLWKVLTIYSVEKLRTLYLSKRERLEELVTVSHCGGCLSLPDSPRLAGGRARIHSRRPGSWGLAQKECSLGHAASLSL